MCSSTTCTSLDELCRSLVDSIDEGDFTRVAGTWRCSVSSSSEDKDEENDDDTTIGSSSVPSPRMTKNAIP